MSDTPPVQYVVTMYSQAVESEDMRETVAGHIGPFFTTEAAEGWIEWASEKVRKDIIFSIGEMMSAADAVEDYRTRQADEIRSSSRWN